MRNSWLQPPASLALLVTVTFLSRRHIPRPLRLDSLCSTIMPSRGFAERPQTLRQAKRAFAKRGGSLVSEEERRRIARAAELDRRAEAIRQKEERKKENKRKRDEKEARERGKRRRMGTETAPMVKIEEGQQGIMTFFKGKSRGKGKSEDKLGNEPAKGGLCEEIPRIELKEDVSRDLLEDCAQHSAGRANAELRPMDSAKEPTLEHVCNGASQISIHEREPDDSQDTKSERCEAPRLKAESITNIKDQADQAASHEEVNATSLSLKNLDRVDGCGSQYAPKITIAPGSDEARPTKASISAARNLGKELNGMPPPTTSRVQKLPDVPKTHSPRRPLRSISHNSRLQALSDPKLPLPAKPIPRDEPVTSEWADFFLSNTQVEREITTPTKTAYDSAPNPNPPPPAPRVAPTDTTEGHDEFSSFLDELSPTDLDNISAAPIGCSEVISTTSDSKVNGGNRSSPTRHVRAESQRALPGKGIFDQNAQVKDPKKTIVADDDDSEFGDVDWTDEDLASVGA